MRSKPVGDLPGLRAGGPAGRRGLPPGDAGQAAGVRLLRRIPSSRRIERGTYEDVALRVLAGDQHPDHDTIAAFRQRHLRALAALFVQVLLNDTCIGVAAGSVAARVFRKERSSHERRAV